MHLPADSGPADYRYLEGKNGINSRVELKLIRKGDSLIGTSYYYDSKSNYRRYSVKGYFDDKNNDVIWWDDVID